VGWLADQVPPVGRGSNELHIHGLRHFGSPARGNRGGGDAFLVIVTSTVLSSALFVAAHIPGWLMLGTITAYNITYIFVFGTILAHPPLFPIAMSAGCLSQSERWPLARGLPQLTPGSGRSRLERLEWVFSNDELVDRPAADEVFLNDSFEDCGVAAAVPDALGINHRNRPAVADPQAVDFRAEDPTLLGQRQLPEAALEKFPRRKPPILLAALGVGLIAAQKNVTPGNRHANRLRNDSQPI
jgi:hypothetical protein